MSKTQVLVLLLIMTYTNLISNLPFWALSVLLIVLLLTHRTLSVKGEKK